MAENRSQASFRVKLRIFWLVSIRHRLAKSSVTADETLARYLFHSNEFSVSAALVRPKAFQVKAQNSEHSVYRTARLLHQDICSMAAIHVEPKRDNKKAYGYAQVIADDLAGLACTVQAKEPPKRHAVL